MARRHNRLHPRAGSFREPYDRVLIVTEGRKTEPLYFRELVTRAKSYAVRALADAHETAEMSPSTEVHALVTYLQQLKAP